LPAAFLICLICLLPAGAAWSDSGTDTTGSPDLTGAANGPDSSEPADTLRNRSGRNPVTAAVVSAVMPGAGQIYNRQYFKGTLVLATETVLGIYAGFWYRAARDHEAVKDALGEAIALRRDSLTYMTVEDTVRGTVDTIDIQYASTIFEMRLDTAVFYQEKDRAVVSQAICWAAGCYLYAILDAVDRTGYFTKSTPKKPAVAGWLSAVPGLGLGQYYNGRPGKAGMILMVQSGLGLMALNSARLMRECEVRIQDIRDTSSVAGDIDPAVRNSLLSTWDREWRRAKRERNTYLWYSLFYYLYGIFDAVVDAHLHDYDGRLRFEPDLEPRTLTTGMRLSLRF